MEGGRFDALTVVHKEEESPENSDESTPSPRMTTFYDTKATSSTSSSPKTSRRGTQKRVVQVPIKEVEAGSRLKVETNNTPPSDSWAWRKYGQKPIKGSPYPRGYYRCSSSKGCPARKQVERSRTDPTMVMVTYSCEHNHPWPAASRNNHHNPPTSPPATEATTSNDQLEEEPPIIQTTQSAGADDQKFTSLEVGGGSFVDQYGWFSSDLDSCTSISTTMLESPLMGMGMVDESDMATIFSVREDEESFFADLGELPECTTVFRRRGIERVEEHHRNLAPWCAGTTG